ncbi:terminase family protein [Moorena sp. SIO3A2]|uniref:terminase large subunit domain-containing protein n=1 Tax=Moorena sp. SIO3A2 TaxID=2607841 RepID=UPI0013B7C85C|nr:terminase family protein [Moorena sp. SIO3A2]NER90364.1 hypothetical protein [Moorena sp. SIO3A2]
MKAKNYVRLKHNAKHATKDKLKKDIVPVFTEDILLPYQKEFLRLVFNNRFIVLLKSRQIGMTWLLALLCVLRASAADGNSQYYISYNKETTRQFMGNCKWWAEHLQLFCDYVGERLYEDENKDLQVYRMVFASGNVIEALSSNPNNVRGKGGDVVIDEAAFVEQLDEIVRSVTALLMWDPTRTIIVVSTPDVEDHYFYEMVQQAKEGEKGMVYYQVDFTSALEMGLYRRICFLSGGTWTKEGEKEWAETIRNFYRPFDIYELDCQFVNYSQNGLFKAEDFVLMSWDEFGKISEDIDDEVIAFDLATTGRDMGDRTKGKDPFYTFGVHMIRHRHTYIIADVTYAQVNIEDGNEMIVNWLKERKVKKLVLEKEPTSRFIPYMRTRLKGQCKVIGAPPVGDKVSRARPFLNQTSLGNVALLPFRDQKKIIASFCRWPPPQPTPFVSDLVDAAVHAYNEVARRNIQIPVGSVRR